MFLEKFAFFVKKHYICKTISKKVKNMKEKASIFQTVSFMLIIAVTIISAGCTSTDEPSVDTVQSQISTRSEKSFSNQMLTVKEAIEIAKDKLGYNQYPLMSYKVEYILSQREFLTTSHLIRLLMSLILATKKASR